MPTDLQILGVSIVAVPSIWLIVVLICRIRHGDVKAANGLAGITASLLPLGILGFKILLMGIHALFNPDSATVVVVIGPADSALVLAAICYQTTVIISDLSDHWKKASKEASKEAEKRQRQRR